MSEKNSLGIVLDKSNNISVIFLEKRYDYTDKVLDLLLKNSGNKKSEISAKEEAKSERLQKLKDVKSKKIQNLK